MVSKTYLLYETGYISRQHELYCNFIMEDYHEKRLKR